MRAVFPAVRRLSAGPVHSRLTYELTACQTELRAANGLLRTKLHSELPLNPVAGRQSNTPAASLRFTAAHWR